MTILSLYVPARTVTVGMALFCAAAIAPFMAVNCAEPSAATVKAVGLTELAEADETDEEEDGRVEETIDESDDVSELVDEVDDASDEELDWAATNPIKEIRRVTSGRMLRRRSDSYLSNTQSEPWKEQERRREGNYGND